MATLNMRRFSYSREKAAIFDRKGSGFTSYGLGFCVDTHREESSAEELLKEVLKFDPKLKHCAERQTKVLGK